MNIFELRQKYYLDEDTLPLLESISWQYDKARIKSAKDLRLIAQIARRYYPHTLKALSLVDRAVEKYLRKKKTKEPVGNFRQLDEREKEIRNKGIILDLSCFKKRLETILLRNNNK